MLVNAESFVLKVAPRITDEEFYSTRSTGLMAPVMESISMMTRLAIQCAPVQQKAGAAQPRASVKTVHMVRQRHIIQPNCIENIVRRKLPCQLVAQNTSIEVVHLVLRHLSQFGHLRRSFGRTLLK